jgi:hypothetical protein
VTTFGSRICYGDLDGIERCDPRTPGREVDQALGTFDRIMNGETTGAEVPRWVLRADSWFFG